MFYHAYDNYMKHAFPMDELNPTRATVKEMFYHAYDNYMKHAFPMDELNPSRCSGKGRDYVNPKNGINDVLGDYCLTLIDSLDTLLVMGDHEEFKRAITLIVKHVNFSRHANRVQVFETSIRILGGLLSGHLLATDVKLHRHLNFTMEGHYNGQLLDLAYDLGKRLLPAFEESKTDLPFARVNLVYGVDKGEISETCTAGAGTLLLEFGLLSRLTGDQRFEELAKKSIESIWAKRSSLNLVGNTLDVNTGAWIHKDSGINAGIDSFYEYLLKAYVVFGDKYYLEMFEESYKAVLAYVRDPEGYMYRPVHMDTGQPFATWIDSLSAFFPGLQVMYGDLPNAIRLHEVYYSIWRKYNALPERFDYIQKNVNLPYYPLRPELIESTYFLYQATSADYYLEAGATFLKDLQKYTKTKCGYASIKHVVTKSATVKEMFYHAYDNYMKHAFPMDELNPTRCSGKGRDYVNPKNGINDVLGDYCLTLIDSLDTLLVVGDHEEFKRAITLIVKHVNFSRHANRVQVFETSIRILGGLLSGHLLATDVKLHRHLNFTMEGHYNGELLDLAYDLGKRLLPAFEESKTDLPFARVNLVYGVDKGEISETCTAGAGTLLLEFGLLSRLTGDQRFEELAKKSIESIWAKRSSLNLVGNTLDVNTGEWIHKDSGINAGIDSFYEYLLKAYVVFGDKYYLEMFEESYKAVLAYVRDPEGYMYRPVHMDTGQPFATWIDSLSAFFPGLQVMYGDLPNAIRLHEVYYSIWRKYNALPERFDYIQKNVNLPYYPLRPELIESTYFLYQATSADYYLEAGATFLKDLQKYTKTKCGYASIKHVVTKSSDDRMESFFLSETLKYLYLLFDSDNYFNRENIVFTTEAHILYVDKDILKLPETVISWDTTRRRSAKERLKDQLNLKKNSLVCKKPKIKPYIAPTPLLEPKEVDYVNFLTGLDYSKPAEAVGMCLNTGRKDKTKLMEDITHVFFDYKEMFSSNENSDIANHVHKSASIQWLENGDILLDTVNQLKMVLNSVGDGIAISQIKDFKVNPNRRIFVSQNGLKSLNKDQPFFPEFEVAMLRVFRPESTYFLYQATSADYYLEAGATFLKDLQKYTKTKCGYASIKHVVTKSSDDRMESFFLSETLKYLYLLFDSDNYFNREDVVFTTEAHILYVDKDILKLPQTVISWDTTRRRSAKERLKDQLNLKKSNLVCKKPKIKPYIAATPLLEPKEVDYVNFLTGLDYSKPAEAVGMCLNTGRNEKTKLMEDAT
ncbi:hypothetical protein MP638_000036, partial [Amoeboaphelidium occidentale]